MMGEHTDKVVLPDEVADAFRSSAVTTLCELTQFESIVEKNPQAISLENHIVAVVRLMRHVPGKLILALLPQAAAELAERYLPDSTELTDEMIDDVMGEFANVIAGQAKTILKGTPYHFTLSIPVVSHVMQGAEVSALAGAALVASLVFDSSRLLLLLDLTACPGA